MNQGEASNHDANIFETHIIPEEESVHGQEDDDLSFQPWIPFKLSINQGQINR